MILFPHVSTQTCTKESQIKPGPPEPFQPKVKRTNSPKQGQKTSKTNFPILVDMLAIILLETTYLDGEKLEYLIRMSRSQNLRAL